MAVTAHWIQAIPEQMNMGVQYKLRLRADLIGFQSMPGRHTGLHLAEAFIEVLDRVNIVSKVRIRLILTNHLTVDIAYCCRLVGSLLIMLLIMIALLTAPTTLGY